MSPPAAVRSLAGLEVRPLPPGDASALFTVDVEDWYHANFRSAPLPSGEGLERRVEPGVEALLELLAESGVRATFFVLGRVALDHPGLVARIAAGGHEIACHDLDHVLVHERSPAAFREQVRRARDLLREQSGQPIHGFRSPSWSITEKSLWALEALAECGFRYDSSIFPSANYLYGIAGAPTEPYRVRTPGGGHIVEVPPSVLSLGPLRLGVGGGVYLRALPLVVHRWARGRFARRGAPFLTYVHPREFDPGSWSLRLPLSRSEQWIHRTGIAAVRRRVAALLRDGPWRAVEEMLRARGALGDAP